ncbi:MAG: TetR/AcrR family transcriptional regulator [Actinomycetota bacterium]|nr:TetR/AcrR family transcriptional regulator [Actinomycetota bacterium]
MADEAVTDTVAGAPTRRERVRAATIDEIKQTALTLMRQQATTDVRFADIARSMGLTAPALYRYFADRDELLTAMIVDAYEDLAAALGDATSAVAHDDVWGQLVAIAQAYRLWARRDPAQFALIFGMPVPGYAAPADGPTAEAAKRAMGNLEGVVVAAIESGRARPALVGEVNATLASELEADSHVSAGVPPAARQAMLLAWVSLHGFACLEAYGQLAHLSEEARDALFAADVRLSAAALGLPGPE